MQGIHHCCKPFAVARQSTLPQQAGERGQFRATLQTPPIGLGNVASGAEGTLSPGHFSQRIVLHSPSAVKQEPE
eukprot:1084518-Heterocapsa_arctica.AAC.1